MFEIEEKNKPTYFVDNQEYKRFDQRNTAFNLLKRYPEKFNGRETLFTTECHVSNEKQRKHNFSTILSKTVQTIKSELLETNISSNDNEDLTTCTYCDSDNTKNIKTAAALFGADKSGICLLNKDWIYSHSEDGNKIEIDEDMTYGVILLTAMETQAILKGTDCNSQDATMIGYLKGSLCASSLALFIRNSGYKALCYDNSFALSVPLAIDAGLGEMSRNGMLVTPEFGSLVRISKVITNMPLKVDKPISMGITDFCSNCNKCSKNCPAGAIDCRKEPNFDSIAPCGNTGIKRWQIDALKCLKYWLKMNISCSGCLKVCPLNKIFPQK